jgi:hypothetical protein
MECSIGLTPGVELSEYRFNEFIEKGKVAIVSAKATNQLPDSLDGIELRAVRREKVKAQAMAMLIQPGLEQAGVMPPGVVENYDHLFPSPQLAQDLLQEDEKGLGTELLGSLGYQSPVADANGPKDTDTFPGRCMENHRVSILWRHPHGAPRTMLTEVAFILAPQIKIVSSGKTAQFFYISAGPRGQLWQSGAGAFADEIRDDGTVAGTAAPQHLPHSGWQDDD